jgi:hypothetical protein
VYDFIDKQLGKGIPYGVYDVTINQGWVSVGRDHDTAEFACETIRRWWRKMGMAVYREATELLIMADGGGSNGSRCRLWKVCLQKTGPVRAKVQILRFSSRFRGQTSCAPSFFLIPLAARGKKIIPSVVYFPLSFHYNIL